MPIELEVSNFGPIVEAKIDLRPLTVFVGPSNTGKSYLAILIYALHRYFTGGLWPRHRMFRRDGDEKLPREAIKSIVELAEQMLEDEGKPGGGQRHYAACVGRGNHSFPIGRSGRLYR